MNINQNKLVLVDGSSFLFRAYYALPALSNSKGEPTGAILGVINMLNKLINAYTPTWMAVVFDSNKKTNRHELFPNYKKNRIQMPEDLASQIQPLLEIIAALGLSIIQIPGIEADDIIGSLVAQANVNNIFSIIATGDKDLAQLVNDNVILINTMNNTSLNYSGVIEKFGVPPNLIVDYLVLTGDQADNIPGVPNVGPKTAVKWLKKYGNISNIIQHSEEITGKVGVNLRTAIKNFALYQKLITININLELNIKIQDFIIKTKDYRALKELFTNLNFSSWLKELNDIKDDSRDSNKSFEQPSLISNESLKDWIALIKEKDLFAIHFVTTGKNYFDSKITGVYLAIQEQNDIKTCYFNCALSGGIDTKDSSLEHTINSTSDDFMELLQLLQRPDKIKLLYDLKFAAHLLNNYSCNIVPPFLDLTLESYVLDSNNQRRLKMDNIDANQILSLHQKFWDKLIETPKLLKVLLDIELPLTLVLKKMERTGVLIDIIKLNQQGIAIKQQISALEAKIYILAKKVFNLNSPKQLQEILYSNLGLPILQKTPKGQPSTSEVVLQDLALEFELPALILQYRTLTKLQSTYIDKLPKNINPETGRVHTSYNQTITSTGRLSSSDPNLQNIPIKTPEGKNIREAFIAREGYKILSADYSQIELRILAHLSEDPSLVKAFTENKDIHAITASEIFHKDLNKVTTEERRKAKAINFGLIYGMSDFGLARQLKISRHEASNYINIYFEKFPKVLDFIEETRKFALKKGFVETMFGRRVYLTDLKNKNGVQRKAAERAAINAPMQGAQADLIKIAMINLNQWIENEQPDLFMLMQIHDELIFEVPKDNLTIIANRILTIMQNVVKLKVALEVEISYGDNWAEAHI